MATEVVIPKLGMTMEEGTVTEWIAADGATVAVGEVVYNLETDKLETEVEAEAAGVLHHIAEPGATHECGTVVGWILSDGEEPPAIARQQTAAVRQGPHVAEEAGPAGAQPGRVIASPKARRLARELNVDLVAVTGTGPGARIVSEDVEAAAVPDDPNTIPMTAMRKIISKRMHQSLQEMAQLSMGMDIDASALVELHSSLKADVGDQVPSYTDFVIAAVALALGEHPLLNAEVTDNAIQLLDEINVGMAVALDDGLIVPVLRQADLLPLDELAVETSRLAAAALDGKLELTELEGATFSVTALGMFGVDFFTPIINPPNVGILGVGRIRNDGQMTLSLTIDHRAVDGAPGALFLGAVRDLLEHPNELVTTRSSNR